MVRAAAAFALTIAFLMLTGALSFWAWYIVIPAGAVVYVVNAVSRAEDGRRLMGPAFGPTMIALALADVTLGMVFWVWFR